MGEKPKILIVEDEAPIRTGLIDLFVYHGYDVASASDGRQGLEQALSGKYDLILLDVMLPEVDGFTICNKVRERDREQLIIMLTAKTADEDIITGLSLGADDYIAKPFSVRELMLRAEAVLRRSRRLRSQIRELDLGSMLIDADNLEGVFLGPDRKPDPRRQRVPFTRKEIEILEYLLENRHRPVSREELLSEVWDYSRAAQIETRTVDIHIAKLRRKIEADPKDPKLVITVRGEGYRLCEGGA